MNIQSPSKPKTRKLILYHPHEAQLKFHQSKARYRVASWGRQSGKSTACLNELCFKAWEKPSTKYWFISPTFDQARIQYRRLVGMLSCCWDVLLKNNQTELRVKFINNSEITFKSGEVNENLRGETLDGLVLDEVREQPDNLWNMVLRPMLTTTQGWACFVSTPNGYDQFYDFYQKGIEGVKGWESFHSQSICNPLFTQLEFEQAQSEMGEDEFAQEILAEFREMGVGKVYKNHSQQNQLIENPFAIRGQQWSPYLPIIVGLDFNVGIMCWVLGQMKGSDFYFGDEIAVKNTDSEQCAQILAEKVKGHKPGVILIGDASGSSRKTSAAGKTDYSIIKNVLDSHEIKYENRTPEVNPHVKDRVNCVNSRLKAADGSIHLWYHPMKCKYLKRNFERDKWKEGTSDAVLDKTDAFATHASDAAGYPIAFYSDLFRAKPGLLRVIER